jgi:hypothetical protein
MEEKTIDRDLGDKLGFFGGAQRSLLEIAISKMATFFTP